MSKDTPSEAGKNVPTAKRLPRNELGRKMAQEIAEFNRNLKAEEKATKKKARFFFQKAALEVRLKNSERKLQKEMNDIHYLERKKQLEAMKRMRVATAPPRGYMVEATYLAKQRRLNEMLINDKRRPRFSQPKPTEIPGSDGDDE